MVATLSCECLCGSGPGMGHPRGLWSGLSVEAGLDQGGGTVAPIAVGPVCPEQVRATWMAGWVGGSLCAGAPSSGVGLGGRARVHSCHQLHGFCKDCGQH